MNRALGVPVIVLTTIVGTTIFGSLSTDPSTGLRLAAGLLSLAAAVLAALQTFFKFGERAEQHRVAAARFAAIARRLDLVLLDAAVGSDRGPERILTGLTSVNEELDLIQGQSPDASDRAYDQAVREQASDLDPPPTLAEGHDRFG